MKSYMTHQDSRIWLDILSFSCFFSAGSSIWVVHAGYVQIMISFLGGSALQYNEELFHEDSYLGQGGLKL